MKHSDGFDEGLIKVFGRRALPRSRGGLHAYPCRMSHLVSRRVLVMGLLGVGTVTLVSGCGAESNSSSSAGSTQPAPPTALPENRSEEHTSELQSLMRISYAVFCLNKKKY